MPRNDQRLPSGNQYQKFWTPLRLKALNILRLHGFTHDECEHILCVGPVSTRKAASEYEITARVPRHGYKRKELEAKVASLCGPGITDTEIARKLAADGHKINSNSVGYIRRRLRIPSGCGWGGNRRVLTH